MNKYFATSISIHFFLSPNFITFMKYAQFFSVFIPFFFRSYINLIQLIANSVRYRTILILATHRFVERIDKNWTRIPIDCVNFLHHVFSHPFSRWTRLVQIDGKWICMSISKMVFFKFINELCFFSQFHARPLFLFICASSSYFLVFY